MFGSSAFQAVQDSPRHLVVSSPGSSMFGAWFLLICLIFFPAIFGLIGRTMKKQDSKLRMQYPNSGIAPVSRKVYLVYLIGSAIAIGAPMFFWAIGYTSGSIDLDALTNKATVRAKMMAFVPAQTRTIDLSLVDRATLDYKPNSRRIRLTTLDGSDLAYPIWSDKPGQQEAVVAINHFLEAQTKK